MWALKGLVLRFQKPLQTRVDMNNTVLKTFAITSLIVLMNASNAFAQSTNLSSSTRQNINPVLEEITDGSVPEIIVEYEEELAQNGLPDGRVVTGTGDIAKAWYSEATTRYRHGVLGDAIEAGALKVQNQRGETYTFRLPRNEVFEDITPRLADLDGDGKTEVITILSSADGGGSVAVFNLNGNAFIKVGQSDFIGRPNRWLNIAEIDTFSGSSTPEIALIVTPHLAGVLQFYRFQNGQFTGLSSQNGYSNHEIGSGELRLSTSLDVDGDRRPDLVIPSLNRSELVFYGLIRNRFVEKARIDLPARINKAIGTREVNGETQIIIGLDNDKVYSVSLQ